MLHDVNYDPNNATGASLFLSDLEIRCFHFYRSNLSHQMSLIKLTWIWFDHLEWCLRLLLRLIKQFI